MLSSVDLPQPVGPTTDTNSPARMRSVVSATAVYRCPGSSGEWKVTVMSIEFEREGDIAKRTEVAGLPRDATRAPMP